MAWALAYLGTLAAACFVLWLLARARERSREWLTLEKFAERLLAVEARVANAHDVSDLDSLRATVSTLAVRAGLEPKGPRAAKG